MTQTTRSHGARFAAKLTQSRTRTSKKGRPYYVYRVLIPRRVAEKLRLQPGDYVSVALRKALWYDLLKWEKMPLTWAMLPPWLKKRISERLGTGWL